MATFISVLSVLGDFANILLAGLAVFALTRILDLDAFFSERRMFKEMGEGGRDILKAIMVARTGTLIRQDGVINQSISLVPIEDGAYVRKSHLTVTRYMSALEFLVDKGCLRKEDGEDGIDYRLTSSGARFIERFSKKLSSHQFVGRFSDDVHHAKMLRLNVQLIEGTVHTAIGAPPLGEVNDPYATSTIACIPPKEQKDGIVAIAYIIGKDLPVNEGDMVFVKFEQTPYHVETYPSPRWIYRVSEDVDEHVPTGNFTVRNIHSREDGMTELSLSTRRVMRPVT